MLVQSHDGAIHLLPALPDVWKEGTLKGIRCRGGFTVNEMKWENGKLQTAVIASNIGGTLRIRTQTPFVFEWGKIEPNYAKSVRQPAFATTGHPQAINCR